MRHIEDRCVGPCPMGCMGRGCPNRDVEVYECDLCGEETTDPEGWKCVDGEDICPNCWDDEEEDDLK